MQQEEYEVISYPRLNHVRIGYTHLTYRNPHVHSEMEICLVLGGSASVHLREQSFEVTQGSMMVFNSNEMHEIVSRGRDGARVMFLQIANQFCRDYMRQLCDYEFLNSHITACVSPAQSWQLQGLILHLLDNYSGSGQISTLNCLADICQLLSLLFSWVPCRLIDESDFRTRSRRSSRLRQITQYIDARFTGKVTLQELAAQLGLTVTYLSHFIRENMGMTFQEYLNNVRLEKALQLMESTDMNLIDISLSSGFSDIKYMTRAFGAELGCSPREYRKSLQTDQKIRKERRSAYQNIVTEDVSREWIRDFTQQREMQKAAYQQNQQKSEQ